MAIATHVITTDSDSPFERAGRVNATVQVIAGQLETTPAWVQVYFAVVLGNTLEGALGLSAVFLSDDYGPSTPLSVSVYQGGPPTDAFTLANSGTQIDFITMNGKGPFSLSRKPASWVNIEKLTEIVQVFDDGRVQHSSPSVLDFNGQKISMRGDNYGVSGIVSAEYSYYDSIYYADAWLTPDATGLLKPASGSVFWALTLDGIIVTSGQQQVEQLPEELPDIPPLGVLETAAGIITTVGGGGWTDLRVSPLSGYY